MWGPILYVDTSPTSVAALGDGEGAGPQQQVSGPHGCVKLPHIEPATLLNTQAVLMFTWSRRTWSKRKHMSIP